VLTWQLTRKVDAIKTFVQESYSAIDAIKENDEAADIRAGSNDVESDSVRESARDSEQEGDQDSETGREGAREMAQRLGGPYGRAKLNSVADRAENARRIDEFRQMRVDGGGGGVGSVGEQTPRLRVVGKDDDMMDVTPQF